MPGSQVIITLKEDTAFVRVLGEGTFQQAVYLKKSYGNLLQKGINRFVIDLAECTILDSTFLGILLGLGLRLIETKIGYIRFVNANAQVLELLKNVGLDHFFFGTDTDLSNH